MVHHSNPTPNRKFHQELLFFTSPKVMVLIPSLQKSIAATWKSISLTLFVLSVFTFKLFSAVPVLTVFHKAQDENHNIDCQNSADKGCDKIIVRTKKMNEKHRQQRQKE